MWILTFSYFDCTFAMSGEFEGTVIWVNSNFYSASKKNALLVCADRHEILHGPPSFELIGKLNETKMGKI